MERPILFSTEMVQALLAGRKTQTRRLLKEAQGWDPIWKPTLINQTNLDGIPRYEMRTGTQYSLPCFKCPFGKPGDLLWVRENWQLSGWNLEEAEMQIKYQAGGTLWTDLYCPNESFDWFENQIDQLEAKGIIKQSSGNDDFFEFTDKPQPWKPNIHMPKAAARIWLKVTNMRVERLQDISKEDAIAEGIEKAGELFKFYMNPKPNYWKPAVDNPIISFHSLWECINGINSWAANPWVWVVEFEVISTTGRANVKEEVS